MKQTQNSEPNNIISFPLLEQGNVEKELKWRTQLLQDYIDNAVIGLHWVNEEGIKEWVNKAELDMLGYSEEE
jgi:PAS domain-containing protein